jgi:hypothetical protein
MTSERKPQTKHELILEAWEKTGSKSVGTSELMSIQHALKETLGPAAIESPASLARTLADAGIPMRHPEILETDLVWRQSRLYELFGPDELDFRTLDAALESMHKLENLRLAFDTENDEPGLKGLVEHVRELKASLQRNTDVGSEIVQWLTVWLQNPRIFLDWLALRRRSAEFLSKFGE